MATDIVIPQVGESITEGVIAAWLVGEGEYVERDAPVLEIETDKITVEVPAPAAGTVSHGASEGDTVEIGATVGAIAEGDAPAKSESSGASAKKEKSESGDSGGEKSSGSGSSVAAADDAVKREAQKKTDSAAPGEHASAKGNAVKASSNGSVNATPLAKKLAEDHGIDLGGITPTGPAGRVREQDVLAIIQGGGKGSDGERSSATAAAPSGGSRGVNVKKMSPLRQRIAQRLVEAQQTAAMLTTFNECDMTNVMELRSRHKDAFLKKHDVKLGFMSFFIKASVSALQNYPAVNSFLVEGPAIEEHDYCDIAVAVGTKKGLVVPVLRNCETLGFAEIESGLGELAAKARDGKLALEDMQGGTFTISNGGVYGSLMSTPILNAPQSGILGMHNIVKRAVEHPDKPGEIALRPMMYLALSYDHRMVDGAGAVGFLKHIKECIEDPERLLLSV